MNLVGSSQLRDCSFPSCHQGCANCVCRQPPSPSGQHRGPQGAMQVWEWAGQCQAPSDGGLLSPLPTARPKTFTAWVLMKCANTLSGRHLTNVQPLGLQVELRQAVSFGPHNKCYQLFSPPPCR